MSEQPAPSGRGRGSSHRNKGGRSGRGGGNKGNAQSTDGATDSIQNLSLSENSQPKGGRGGNRGKGDRRKRSNVSKDKALWGEEKIRHEEELQLKQQVAEAEAIRRQEMEDEEAVRKLLEEEQKRNEAIKLARQNECQAIIKKVQDNIAALESFVATTLSHKRNRDNLSAENLVKSRGDFEQAKKSIKSDLKKCTAFVKKVKSGVVWSMKPDDVVSDMLTLNLTRYVEEVAAAVLEAKLKVGDFPVLVALCVAMHARYAEFLPNLVPTMWSTIHLKPTEETAKFRRIYVRLITEFLLNGVIREPKQLIKLIGEVTGGSAGTYAVSDANVMVSFCKAAGFEILGGIPRSIREDLTMLATEVKKFEASAEDECLVVMTEELMRKSKDLIDKVDKVLQLRAVMPEVAEGFYTHCQGAYYTLSKSLIATHEKLCKLEKRCEQDRLLQGSLSDAREKGLMDARKLHESLYKSVETLSDVLDQVMPALIEEKEEENEVGQGIELWTKGEEGGDDDLGPFDDEETRSFYCDISDLLATIPPALLGMSDEEIERVKRENLRKYGEEAAQYIDDANAEIEPTSEDEFLDKEAAVEQHDKEEGNDGKRSENDKDNPHYRLAVLLEQELPECSRREQIDELSEKFCLNHGSSKTSRKRLVKTLFQVPRSRLDLLPYYSRMLAILDRVYSDFASPVVADLEQQFHGQAKFKKNQNLEGRLKTARYIGELTKFRVAPPIVSLRCFRRCLDDFTGFNVDVACCILESCGRYLYRTKHTVSMISQLMDAMTRISNAKHLDERANALVKSAMYMVKPPPSAPRKEAKAYPPLESYLRYLMLVKLEPGKGSILFVSKQLLQFPWNDPSQQCGALICRYMLKACRKGRFNVISAVAGVAANMCSGKPEAATRLVDACLEEIQSALENPNFRDQQRTITYARLLGELLTKSLVTGQVVLQQLYNFLNFGHEIPEALREASEKLVGNLKASENLPVYNSSGGVSQTIGEDEVMDDTQLVTNELEKSPEVVAVSKYSKFDPRVPSLLDPPNSAFRIKLVCSLLEVATTSLVTKGNLLALNGFCSAFQRYLFTKSLLPMDVEFALLNTFDAIDSQWKKASQARRKRGEAEVKNDDSIGFPRFSSWMEAHNATVLQEEKDQLAVERARARLETVAAGGAATEMELLGDAELALLADDDDFDVMSQSLEDEVESETDTEDENKIMDAEEEDGVEVDDLQDDDFDSEDYEVYDDAESIDEGAYMKQLEEEAFERELRRVTMEALDKGKNSAQSRGKVADNMITGSQFVRKKEKGEESPLAIALGGMEGVTFQLLKKSNKGKVEAKQLIVPKDTNLAKQAEKNDDEAARERDMLKAHVLQYEAESSEHGEGGGNVYLEQTKLQLIRNRPLTMQEIDQNFGTSRGDRDVVASSASRRSGGIDRSYPQSQGHGMQGRGTATGQGHSGGGGRGRGSGGRTLRTY